MLLGGIAGGLLGGPAFAARPKPGGKLGDVKASFHTRDGKLTPYESATHYNNFYEFGVGKGDLAKNSKLFKPAPAGIVGIRLHYLSYR